MSLRRNVLIFHSGALGDFVLTWPIATALGRLYPQSRIFFVTAGAKGKLVEKAIGVDSIDVEAGWHPLFAENAELTDAVRTRLESAHTILTFVSSGNDIWAENVRRLAPEAQLIALLTPPRGKIGQGMHVSEFFLKQLEGCPVVATATEQIMQSVAHRGIGGRLPADGRILVHPGAGAATKCWPVEKFASLAEQLKIEGHKVEFVLGEVEIEKWSEGEVDRLSRIAAIQRPKDLTALYQLVRSASCFIGNDSGPGHLAGMVGVPTVVIGAGELDSWKPMGPAVRVVGAERIEDVDVAAVSKAVREIAA